MYLYRYYLLYILLWVCLYIHIRYKTGNRIYTYILVRAREGWRVQVIPSVDGRDLWALVRGNTIRRTWRAPLWLSCRSRAIVRANARGSSKK